MGKYITRNKATLEFEITRIIMNEIHVTIHRVDCLDGKVRLIGFPKKTHHMCDRVFCYIWEQNGEDTLSWYKECDQIPPWYAELNVNIPKEDFSEDEMELAEAIIRGK